jgi:preprotein translocase subunit Sss1
MAATVGGSMTFGASLLLIAVGAILKFAVNPYVLSHSVNLNVVGVVLMVVGVIGFVLALFYTSYWRRTFAP